MSDEVKLAKAGEWVQMDSTIMLMNGSKVYAATSVIAIPRGFDHFVVQTEDERVYQAWDIEVCDGVFCAGSYKRV